MKRLFALTMLTVAMLTASAQTARQEIEKNPWLAGSNYLDYDRQLPDFRRPVQRVSYLDGCKVYFDDAWVIIRFSGTEPRVRIFAEADTIHHAKTLVGTMADFVGLPFDA